MLSGEKLVSDLSYSTSRQTMLTEKKLIEEAVRDPAAFSALYQQNAHRVYRYAFARLGSHAEAEDLTSQVFMTVLQKLKDFGGNKNFSAWLFTIARNKIIDNYRREKKLVPLDWADSLHAEGGDPSEPVIELETFSQLALVIQDLPPEQQEVLQLRFAAELSYAEIGEVVGKSEAAVKMSVHRLLRQMQAEMEKNDE